MMGQTLPMPTRCRTCQHRSLKGAQSHPVPAEDCRDAKKQLSRSICHWIRIRVERSVLIEAIGPRDLNDRLA